MSLVVFEDVSLTLGTKTIVQGLDLRIAPGERIGLVGPNGSGKTSILRLIAREQQVDGGRLRIGQGMRVGYLPQDIVLDSGLGVLDFVVSSVPGRAALETEIADTGELLAKAVAAGADAERAADLAERLSELHERLHHFGVFFTEHEATQILAGLGFRAADLARPIRELSGGWKMRALLAALLFQRPDLLLLDEPTNHLDMPSVAWFGAFLRKYAGAFILICHDREFLNEQISRVISFEPEGVRTYPGNYEQYKAQRAEEEVVLKNKARNLAREREKAEEFIDRFRAKASKASAVQSRVKALEKMEEVHEYESRRVMRFRFPPCERAGNEVLRGEGLTKRYGERTVFAGVDLSVQRGEKIAIIGANGAGKTTLLRMLAGELEPSEGTVSRGHNTRFAYYAQHHTEKLHPTWTVFDEVKSEGRDLSLTQVRTLLGSFLFGDDDIEKKIGVLSGGERARVALAKMLAAPGNVMLMDEPTNHLDLESSEALAEALASYEGTLLFVSHNRSFVRRLATKIWDMEDGRLKTYPGTLDEYLESERLKRAGEGPGSGAGGRAEAPASAKADPATGAGAGSVPPREKGSRDAEKERKRVEAEERRKRRRLLELEKRAEDLNTQIRAVEAAQKQRGEAIDSPEAQADDALRFRLIAEYQTGHTELESLTEAWMEAEEAAEAERQRLGEESAERPGSSD